MTVNALWIMIHNHCYSQHNLNVTEEAVHLSASVKYDHSIKEMLLNIWTDIKLRKFVINTAWEHYSKVFSMHFPEIFCLTGLLWLCMNAGKNFCSVFGIPSHRVLFVRGMLTQCFLFQLQTGRQETTGAALGCWLHSHSVISKHIKAPGVSLRQGEWMLYECWAFLIFIWATRDLHCEIGEPCSKDF